MSTRTDPWPAGTPCWVELAVPDVAGAAAFYADVIGWTFVDGGPDHGGHLVARVDGRVAAGLGPVMAEGEPAGWTVFFASDDADATAALVREHGGSIFAGPTDVPGVGRTVLAADPTGAVFGVWQQTGMIGSAVVDEPGAFVWDDARLHDVDAGRRFYAAVFGFTYAPLPPELGEVPDYATFGPGDRPAGGIGGMTGTPPGTPSHWLAYFTVADVDAAVTAAGDGGGRVLRVPEDTPFGRIGLVEDPFGAVCGLMEPLAAP